MSVTPRVPASTPPHHDPPDRARIDLRLAAPAAAAWLVALALTASPVWLSAATASVAAAWLAVTLLRTTRRRAGHPHCRGPSDPRRNRPSLILTCGAVLLVAVACATRIPAREAGGLRELAAAHATVELVGTVSSATATASGATGTSWVLLALDALRSPDGDWSATGASVRLFLSETPVPGSTIAVAARLAPATGTHDRAVAVGRPVGGVEIRAGPDGLTALLAGRRDALAELARDLPGDAGALLPGVTVGDTSGVGDLDAAMKGSGLAHITAVSGAHFSMVGAAVLLVSSWCGVPRRWRWLPVTAVSIGFVVLVGPGPTVVRAALMGGVGVLGVAVGRPSRAVPALCAAVLVLLIADPWLCADLGFLLSVVATAGIALVAAPLAAAWPGRLPAGVALALAVPVAAQAACAPVILLLDPAVAVYAVPANVIAAPAVGPATLGGLIAACFAGWCPPVAEVAAGVAGAACWWIGTVARVAVALPGARLSWLSGWPGLVSLAVATAAGTALLLRCRRGMAP